VDWNKTFLWVQRIFVSYCVYICQCHFERPDRSVFEWLASEKEHWNNLLASSGGNVSSWQHNLKTLIFNQWYRIIQIPKTVSIRFGYQISMKWGTISGTHCLFKYIRTSAGEGNTFEVRNGYLFVCEINCCYQWLRHFQERRKIVCQHAFDFIWWDHKKL